MQSSYLQNQNQKTKTRRSQKRKNRCFWYCNGSASGVLNVEANRESSRVTVRGVVDPPKLIEFIKKKLGKHAEVVKQEQGGGGDKGQGKDNKKGPEAGEIVFQYPPQYSNQHFYPNQAFSDDNPFACSIM
ncbi:heavy metal-associated isoprenylated plant protein 3-like [Prunus yedoensis var. nudiflora]|uniref:Heavy metal-associated isoprenylated plant protein 3-like n=1 Tax=Prunus yedoensis var. nudiflora TaxID=2094558 RepID=A0A314YXG5_PRUYE|nr:heavy metal-associated isoprenylated plant protein 3-like [Prunus yedoensis var. nudiflora]